jgi:Holliday junction resolvase-like predicted endonuclease
MEMGESLVAAYLRHIRECELVMTNVYTASGQGELDVVGVGKGKKPTVWFCEVTTHIRGMNNPAKRRADERVRDKIKRAQKFAAITFPKANHVFEVWSPKVRPGLVPGLEAVVQELAPIKLDLVINQEYCTRVQALIDDARKNTSATNDDAYRMLQILTRVEGVLNF